MNGPGEMESGRRIGMNGGDTRPAGAGGEGGEEQGRQMRMENCPRRRIREKTVGGICLQMDAGGM